MSYQRYGTVLRYTEDERNRALEVSLTSLAASMGYTPIRQGNNFILKEMDSLVIYNDCSWNRWSGKGTIKGGTQIDFLLEFGNVATVPEAIHQLLSFKGEHVQSPVISHDRESSGRKEFALPPKNKNYKRLFAYLIKTRGLSAEVVQDFVHQNLIYEDSVHHNIVYCGRDPEGEVRYAGLRGTADIYGKKFKMDVPGNDKNYGVNIVNPASDEVKVFESVIDCMSYIDMTGDRTSNKLVLGMVADNPLEQFLKDYSHIKKISLCLDNDPAGQQATIRLGAKYENQGYDVSVEIPFGGKDWNEVLLNNREETAKHNEMIVEMNEEIVVDAVNSQENGKESGEFQKKLQEIDKTSEEFAYYCTLAEQSEGGNTYHRYIVSHLTDEGNYDYSILDEKFRLLDGGELGSAEEVLNEVIPKGMIGVDIVPADFSEVTEKNDMVEEVLLTAKNRKCRKSRFHLMNWICLQIIRSIMVMQRMEYGWLGVWDTQKSTILNGWSNQ